MPEISGYRTLCQADIETINAIKEVETRVMEVIADIEARPISAVGVHPADGSRDPRWCAIGRTDIQTGFMALVRSIAQPNS